MLALFLEWLNRPGGYDYLTASPRVFPEAPPIIAEIPSEVHPRVADMLKQAGIGALYSHQAEAVTHALAGKNVVLSTPTASGKSLAYLIPVLDRLIRDPEARSLLVFPLKALERDQRDSFQALAGEHGLNAAVYDGDTPESERRKIRSNPPRVLITNPDMLHLGLLPYHETWKDFFANLAYVVLDEIHTYKGIFGTHISQVLLRTRRVCRIHGSAPQFIACSATISNPGTFVSTLIGEDVAVVDRSGAPSSERHFVFLKPNLSPYTVASRLFSKALDLGLKTIVFTRARKITELITTWVLQENPRLRGRISSYRAGFLPEERREIEAKLFSGKMDGVICTSALEMGIDVGGLDLCLLVGYPGTVINTWQRGGRVGRGGRPSAIVVITGNDALDQYFFRNPEDFFGRSCEEAVLDPLNPEVLKRHIPCGAAETPILPNEDWVENEKVQALLEELTESGTLRKGPEGGWHCVPSRPHRGVDLRSIGPSFSIFLEDGKTAIGSSSGMRVFTECHEGAVYLHRTNQYLVTKLDLERQDVLVRRDKLAYYTRALSEKDTEILGAPIRSREFPGFSVREARLKVTEIITSYEKRRTAGQDLIGVVELDLPPFHFETVGIWIEIPDTVKEVVRNLGLHFMGGIHALEHAAISMFPLFALCDRDDIGGISTPEHPQVCRAAVFIYDGHAGGVGLAHRAFEVIEELLEKTRILVEKCPCEDGCPSCIHSPKCGSGNKPLDKKACLVTLDLLLHPEKAARLVAQADSSQAGGTSGREKVSAPERAASRPVPKQDEVSPPVIFPDLAKTSGDLPAATVPGTLEESRVERASRRARSRPGSLERSQPALREGEGMPDRLSNQNSSFTNESVSGPHHVVVFDLETQKLAEEVGGWRNARKMGLSVGVTYSEEEGFRTFTEDRVTDLIAALKRADLVVGFNQMRFDYEVLRGYTTEDLRALPNLDILVEVKAAIGIRLSLDHLANATLGRNKTGVGTDAITWFREGKMDLLEQYCRDDVSITRDLYLFGLTNGYLQYKRRDRRLASIAVNWHAGPRPRRS